MPAATFEEILKFNPYHDARGRFSSANGYSSFTYSPGKSKAHDLAIQRLKQRQSSGSTGNQPEKMEYKTLSGTAEMRKFADSYDEWVGSLTNGERESVVEYGSTHSARFNNYLRTGQTTYANATSEQYKALDSALEKSQIPDNITVYRGMSMQFLETGSPESLVGKTVTDKGYVSTSFSESVADVYSGDVVCKINCKKGSRGAYIDEVAFNETSDFGADANNEVLLPRGSKFKVKSVKQRKIGGWEVEMDYEG